VARRRKERSEMIYQFESEHKLDICLACPCFDYVRDECKLIFNPQTKKFKKVLDNYETPSWCPLKEVQNG
jgi:hypothetical protein